MDNVNQTAKAVKSPLALLGDALDHAEATVPALHRLRSRYDGRRFHFPRHPTITAYRDLAVALAAFDTREPPHDPAALNAEIREARHDLQELGEIFDNRCAMRGQRGVEWPDGGQSVSLRALLDVYADMVAERDDLQRLVNFRAGQKQRKIMEDRREHYVEIDGERVRILRGYGHE